MESTYCSTIYVWGWDSGNGRNLYTYIPYSQTGAVIESFPHFQLHGTLELQQSTFAGIKSSF